MNNPKNHPMNRQDISGHDRTVLRELSKKQMAYANAPAMKEKARSWLLHNTFRSDAPMIHLELATFQDEVIPPLLRCENETTRGIETELYKNFLNHELFDDDKVVPDFFPVCRDTYFHLFGHEITSHRAMDSTGKTLGHSFDHVIRDLHDEYHKLGQTTYGVDRHASEEKIALVEEVFGDILPPKRIMNCLYATPTQQIVHIMGMQQMFMAMCDYPEDFVSMMDRAADDYVAYFNWIVKEGLLLSTIGCERLSAGSLCYTDELPATPSSTREVWGFLDSQESVGISPEMFRELIFPYYLRIANCYGLLSYGCCEPVDVFWESVRTLPNLRKISISPWCDEAFMGEQLRGQRTVYLRKPSPNFLGMGETLDEEAVRTHIRKTLEAARGCTLEFAQRDVYTIHCDVLKARRYVRIIREEIGRYWKP